MLIQTDEREFVARLSPVDSGYMLKTLRDVSAVIETPGGFLLYVAREKTDTALNVACLSLPKRSYEQWLYEQSGETK